MSEIRNVFISHLHEDDATLQGLKKLLETNGYSIRDGSIDSSKPNDAKNPDYIKSQILARIQWAGTLIVLVSPQTHTSEWVEWEIEYAQKHDKRIVGIWEQGAQEVDLPENLKKYADAMVGWQAERLMDAINGKINKWQAPDGKEPPPRDIPRIICQ